MLAPAQLGDEVARDVVRGRAESTGGDDKIGAGQCFTHGLFDVAAGIGYGNLAGHDISQIGQAAAEPLLVGVENAPEHQLATGIDEFDVHDSRARKAFS